LSKRYHGNYKTKKHKCIPNTGCLIEEGKNRESDYSVDLEIKTDLRKIMLLMI
jgi:hypothetical protein